MRAIANLHYVEVGIGVKQDMYVNIRRKGQRCEKRKSNQYTDTEYSGSGTLE